MMDVAHEGARDGSAVGTSSVSPERTGSSGREKTGTGMEGAGGKLDEGEGATARDAVSYPGGTESLTVLLAKASISSVEDCVTRTAGAVKGSGEFLAECAVVSEPGPEDCDDELEPFLEDLVEQAPPRGREAKTSIGESPGNQGLRHEQQ